MSNVRTLLVALSLCCAAQAFAGTGRLVVVSTDAPGVGFNDPTPATPVGGNEGTTLGQQRMNVFQAAADRWSALLETNVDIIVNATFAPIPGCTDTSAILGQAGPFTWQSNFPNAPQQNVWYPIALANKFAGSDLLPAGPDITAQFNADVDNAACLGDSDWYYGLDGQHGNDSDLFVVVLHELAHGLGMSGAGTISFLGNRPDVFSTHALDVSAGLRWSQMSEAQRRVSITNTGNLVWDGENVRAFVSRYLEPMTTLTITEPSIIARNYEIGTAAFGPEANATAMSGRIVQALDAANSDGPTTTDGCSTFSNSSAIEGNVALIDRGKCTFVSKARNAQAAGAVGVVIVDQTRDTCSPPGMGGDATDITIPVISISAVDGDALKAQLASSVRGTLRVDPSQLAGATKEGYLRLYTPCTLQPGSSTFHFDVGASPNLLMEPAVNSDLRHGVDLTLYQLADIGWTLPPRTGRRNIR